jgi:hypothetical protein
MKRSPADLLIYVLMLGSGALLLPAGSWANMGIQTPSIVTTLPAATPDPGHPVPANPGAAGTVGIQARQGSIAFHDPACQRDIAGQAGLAIPPAVTSCTDAPDPQQGISVQLGQRVGHRGDILGEFDGIRLDFRTDDGLSVNGIAGYPVLTEADVFNPARQVFGISATTERLGRAWDLNSYLVEQQENGQVTGRSMGGAMRFLRPGRSMLVYLDYDPEGSSIGTLMASGALQLPFSATISATLDLQNRPIPGRQQKYLQQSMTAMEGWDWVLPGDRLAYHTGDGTGEVGVLAVDLSYALSRRIKLRGDVVLLDVKNEADAATRTGSSEYYYHLKITGTDLMVPGDRSKLDLRHSVTKDGRTYTASFDTRYAIKRFWNLISQLRANYHDPADEGRSRWMASPNLKMEYRPSKQFGFHIEAGGNLSNGESSPAQDSRPSYFVSLGYQVNF